MLNRWLLVCATILDLLDFLNQPSEKVLLYVLGFDYIEILVVTLQFETDQLHHFGHLRVAPNVFPHVGVVGRKYLSQVLNLVDWLIGEVGKDDGQDSNRLLLLLGINIWQLIELPQVL